LEGLRVDGRIILKRILKKYEGVAQTGQICLKVGKIGTTKFRWLNLKEKDYLGRPKSR